MDRFDPVPKPVAPAQPDLGWQIDTERLILRPPAPDDGSALHEAVAESLPQLRRFLAALPWVAGEPSLPASQGWCTKAQANFQARTDVPFLMFERAHGRLVGGIGLHRPDWNTPKLELGFWCRSSAQGRGLVTEAAQALCAFGFERLRAVRLEAVIDEQNGASRRVVERCGFALEGVLRRERRAPDGSLRDTCIYARLAD